jgi:tetratricopeptide (TPR) repeat protein
VKIKKVASLRQMGDLAKAEEELKAILEQNRLLVEAQMERGHLLSAKAAAKRGTWAEAIKYWENLAMRLGTVRPRPADYYEAWYQAARSLQAGGNPTRAKQALQGVLKLSAQGIDPAMKARYDELIGQLK